ncbi:hypothetical protein JV173_01190 [Acholeplasma equirhinis]|uniref:hypothetical protein n=1 Tax=Acholeplasma equirhinis TaxID=555393 RepID=UPI00197AE5B5|nr:hypothetical protein [Acholeplasma equirhinis]MBN3490119.1 hypothetical protein [Acholeplasma equirhinis]
MNSIRIKVPSDLIVAFYPHPEPYGDNYFVVDLENGMYTDVFEMENEFYTITNDTKLISYLNKKRKGLI